MNKLAKELQAILDNPFIDEKDYERLILDLIYKRNKDNTLNLFLQIQQKDKEEMRKKINVYRVGLEQATNNFSSISRKIFEEKTNKQAKNYLKEVFESGNLAYIIDICKSYFPKGNADGYSINSQWLFNKFKIMLIKNKETYTEGGGSYSWSKNYNHLEYIKLVLKQK